MKKIILSVVATLLLAGTAIYAQKVNAESFKSKIEKSDSDIANPKKSGKSATWINRGKLFYDVAVEPTKDLFVGLERQFLTLAIGTPNSEEPVTLNTIDYTALNYPYVTVYLTAEGKVAAWNQTKFIVEDAAAMSIEAYNKAYEIDPKSAEKVKAGLEQVINFCIQVGNVNLDSGNYVDAALSYIQAYDAQSLPEYNAPDPSLLYYAGYLYTIDGTKNPASYEKGVEYLAKAIEAGYKDEKGDVYYYLYHSYYGLKDKDAANLISAKDVLLKGIVEFPKNDNILNSLIQLYTAEENIGDPADLIVLIDKAVADAPDNIDLWYGRGRIFYALKNYDESIASFKKVLELNPELFEGNFYIAVFYEMKGAEINDEISAKQYSSQAEYDKDLAVLIDVYMQALPYYEKAYEIKPDDVSNLESLKSLCFRLRDQEGMKEKYEKYNDLFKATQQ